MNMDPLGRRESCLHKYWGDDDGRQVVCVTVVSVDDGRSRSTLLRLAMPRFQISHIQISPVMTSSLPAFQSPFHHSSPAVPPVKSEKSSPTVLCTKY